MTEGGSQSQVTAAEQFFPGQYSAAERDMMTRFKVIAAASVGWDNYGSFGVSEDQIKLWATATNPFNPLFSSETYGATSRFGAMIAAPYFMKHRVERTCDIPRNRHYPFWQGVCDGGEIEYFHPIRAGDRLRSWHDVQTIEDLTTETGSAYREFQITSCSRLVNQRDEEVTRVKKVLRNLYSAKDVDRGQNRPQFSPQLTYDDALWDRIARLERQEFIAGRVPRLWNAVQIGDLIPLVVDGPTTIFDNIRVNGFGVMNLLPMRVARSAYPDSLVKDAYGIPYFNEVYHYLPSPEHGFPAMHSHAMGEMLMARLVTNYISDFGWIRRMKWWNTTAGDAFLATLPQLQGRTLSIHPKIGDVTVARGVVTGKFEQDGAFLARLGCWCEDLDGAISQAAEVLVELPQDGGDLFRFSAG